MVYANLYYAILKFETNNNRGGQNNRAKLCTQTEQTCRVDGTQRGRKKVVLYIADKLIYAYNGIAIIMIILSSIGRFVCHVHVFIVLRVLFIAKINIHAKPMDVCIPESYYILVYCCAKDVLSIRQNFRVCSPDNCTTY